MLNSTMKSYNEVPYVPDPFRVQQLKCDYILAGDCYI